MYRRLSSLKTIETIETLKKRIAERFPYSDLEGVCKELCELAKDGELRAERIEKPNIPLRVLVSLLITVFVGVLIYTISTFDMSLGELNVGGFAQISNAVINNIVLIGAAIVFLVTAESRIKRARILTSLYELRSITHVIDMHQLTKDPSVFMQKIILTTSSPKRDMTPYELTRYLDYCSEMLSLVGKIAALYSDTTRDPVVLATVNEIESLTAGFNRKIWQKMMMLHRVVE